MEFSHVRRWLPFVVVLLIAHHINGVKILKTSNDEAVQTKRPQIAIIGAGIGGSSCAFYLKKFLPEANITIIEANNRIGGRIMSADFEGVTVEVGAAAWASANKYIEELVDELHLPVDSDQSVLSALGNLQWNQMLPGQEAFPSLGIGVWDGHFLIDADTVVLKHLKSTGITMLNVAEFLLKLKLNYFERDATGGSSFQNITEYLSYGGLDEYVKTSTVDFLTKHNVDPALLSYFIEPIMTHIYDQGLDIHPFTALTSLTGVLTSAHSVTGGNSKLPEALVKASKVNINLNSRVHTITNGDTEYSITYTAAGVETTTTADAIVLAVPIEWTGIAFKNFKPDPVHDQPHRKWVYWYVHFVAAKSINNTYFQQSDQWSAPENIFTTANASLPWVSIQLYTALPDFNIYKLFCTQNLTNHMGELFIDIKNIYTHHWEYTFPVFKPVTDPSGFQDIQLTHHGLYNINTIESVASAMEVPVINARNVAMMIAKAVKKDYDELNEQFEEDC